VSAEEGSERRERKGKEERKGKREVRRGKEGGIATGALSASAPSEPERNESGTCTSDAADTELATLLVLPQPENERAIKGREDAKAA
jgi:hypothetical protein